MVPVLIFRRLFTRWVRACVTFENSENIPISALEALKLGKNMVPKRIFLTKGVGKHKERLTSFELALRDAGIAAQTLVRVSSIFPPHCKLIPRKDGLTYLYPGEVTFTVVAENSTRGTTAWLHRASAWRFRQIAAHLATSANTILSGEGGSRG